MNSTRVTLTGSGRIGEQKQLLNPINTNINNNPNHSGYNSNAANTVLELQPQSSLRWLYLVNVIADVEANVLGQCIQPR
jgi:hypothetical protein